jgi:Holliday junction resolvase RusA-like endonuclease
MVLGPDFSAYDRPLYVDLECYITKPKTTKLTMPRGDIDNYQKAVFDAMNDNLWTDDKLIQAVYAVKQWSDRPQGYFVIGVNYAEEYEI